MSTTKAWVIVIALVVLGIVGGWVGYWLGHALGWTTNAEFPLRIGAGERAIGLSILVSFLSVMAGLYWFVTIPYLRMRRLLSRGSPGRATVRRLWRTHVRVWRASDRRAQMAFELDVHLDGDRDYATTGLGLLTDEEIAALAPGAEVDVRYDQRHPTSVAVVGLAGGRAG